MLHIIYMATSSHIENMLQVLTPTFISKLEEGPKRCGQVQICCHCYGCILIRFQGPILA